MVASVSTWRKTNGGVSIVWGRTRLRKAYRSAQPLRRNADLKVIVGALLADESKQEAVISFCEEMRKKQRGGTRGRRAILLERENIVGEQQPSNESEAT